MERFKSYFNQIKAEEALKDNTKVFLQKALAEIQEKSETERENFKMENLQENKKKISMPIKRMLIAGCTVIAISLLSFGGYVYYKTPVNYVSLDINPSVEIGLNAFDKVVDVEAMNDDGAAIIENQDLINLPVDEAIDSLVQEAANQGFIQDDGSTVIAVTAESDDQDKALQLQEDSSSGVDSAITATGTVATVYKDCSDLALRTEAKNLGISPGKYKLIKTLQTLDDTVVVDDYVNVKVSDIMKKAHEITKAQGINGETTDEDDTSDVSNVSDVSEVSEVSEARGSSDAVEANTELNAAGAAICKMDKAAVNAEKAKEKVAKKAENGYSDENTTSETTSEVAGETSSVDATVSEASSLESETEENGNAAEAKEKAAEKAAEAQSKAAEKSANGNGKK